MCSSMSQLGDLGEAVDGPALVVTEGVDPMAMSGRVGSRRQRPAGSRAPVVSPVAEPEIVVAILPGEAEGLEQ